MSGSTSAHACIYHRANMQAGKHAPRAKQKACRELGDVVSSQPHGLKRREVRWSIAHSTSINMDYYDEVLEVLGQRTDNQVLCGLRTGSRTAANLIEHKMLCTLFCKFFRTNFPECAYSCDQLQRVEIIVGPLFGDVRGPPCSSVVHLWPWPSGRASSGCMRGHRHAHPVWDSGRER